MTHPGAFEVSASYRDDTVRVSWLRLLGGKSSSCQGIQAGETLPVVCQCPAVGQFEVQPDRLGFQRFRELCLLASADGLRHFEGVGSLGKQGVFVDPDGPPKILNTDELGADVRCQAVSFRLQPGAGFRPLVGRLLDPSAVFPVPDRHIEIQDDGVPTVIPAPVAVSLLRPAKRQIGSPFLASH